jgi:hypothetical protein
MGQSLNKSLTWKFEFESGFEDVKNVVRANRDSLFKLLPSFIIIRPELMFLVRIVFRELNFLNRFRELKGINYLVFQELA